MSAAKNSVHPLVLFAVATTMTKDEPARMNVQTILVQVEALSRMEAIGMAHEDAAKRLPEHRIFTTACIEIKHSATPGGTEARRSAEGMVETIQGG